MFLLGSPLLKEAMKQPVERRLTAVLATDVAGYSRLMGADEEGTTNFSRHISVGSLTQGSKCIVAGS